MAPSIAQPTASTDRSEQSASSTAPPTASTDKSVAPISASPMTIGSSLPPNSSLPAHRTRSMVTWSQDGTRQPRILPSMVTDHVSLQEPRSFKQAHQLAEWRQAMVEEYSALL
ncbi:hypothetical protein SLEP1_g49952 [Rubroshorea leprosula]|uniref:Uncharacterized protein n=1 Tax=Rubroshorea leprosula TaxID=152421 RepID=A0AAV5LZS9_9ROSI|nr:hypothetical protein SLEP1_g49952 [Rubroshorea leprosula]